MTGKSNSECRLRIADFGVLSGPVFSEGDRSDVIEKPVIAEKSKIQNPKSTTEKGFSLFELMISMFILIILLSVAVPVYQRTVQHAKETVLKENLWQMRRAIEQYRADKGKLPAGLEDLVEAKYLREIPTDPILEKAEWDAKMGDDPSSTEGEQGVIDVKSTSLGQDSSGNSYNGETY